MYPQKLLMPDLEMDWYVKLDACAQAKFNHPSDSARRVEMTMVVAEKCCQHYQDKTKKFLKHQGGSELLLLQSHRHSLRLLGHDHVSSALPGVQIKADASKFRGREAQISVGWVLNLCKHGVLSQDLFAHPKATRGNTQRAVPPCKTFPFSPGPHTMSWVSSPKSLLEIWPLRKPHLRHSQP